MKHTAIEVPPQISSELETLLQQLNSLGLTLTGATYDAEHFGNYVVDLTGPRGTLRLTRDRSQYMIGGDEETLKRLNSWRAFNSLDEFTAAVLQYAQCVT